VVTSSESYHTTTVAYHTTFLINHVIWDWLCCGSSGGHLYSTLHVHVHVRFRLIRAIACNFWASRNTEYDTTVAHKRGGGESPSLSFHAIGCSCKSESPGWASSGCPWLGTLSPKSKPKHTISYACRMTQIWSCARVRIAISRLCAKANLNHTADFEGILSLYS